MKTGFWRWIIVGAAGAIAYALYASWLAPHFTPVNDLKHHVDYQVALQLPARVAEGAFGEWLLLPALWALVGLLALVCIRAAQALAADGRTWLLFAGQAVLLAACMLVAVTVSGDVYAYVIYGRLYGIHDVNPYLLGAPVSDFGDAILRRCFAFYGDPPPGDNYGPLWTLLAGATARLEAGASLGAQVWSYRIVAALAALAATAGIVRLLKGVAPPERLRRCALFAFHPLVVYESAVGGHNDILMAAPAIWAFALLDELPLVAGLLLGASIAIKYVSLILVPFFAIRAARRGLSNGIVATLVACALPLLFFKPFWAGATTLYSLIGHGGIFDMSPLWLAAMPFFLAGTANAPALGGSVSLPLFGQPSWPRLFELVALLIVVGVLAVSARRYARTLHVDELWRAVTALLLSLPIIHPWYVVWLMPAAADRARWAVYAWWFGLLIFLRYGLDGVAPAQAGPLFTPALVVLTLVFLIVPAVLAFRDTRLTPPAGVVRNSEGRADTV